jgi:sec-independent protein translocase protein TatA
MIPRKGIVCYVVDDRCIANGGTADGWFVYLSAFYFPSPTYKETCMFGLQPVHLLIIVVVAVLLFVPGRLPEMVRSLGKTVREFRVGLKEAAPQAPPESASVKTTPKDPSH